MKKYELVFITDPEKSDEQVQAVADEAKAFIEKEDGTVELVEQWGKRKLAYTVKKNRYGYYTLFHYGGPAETVSKVEIYLKHNESVIKYITLKYDPRSAVKPPQMESGSLYGTPERQGNYRRDY